MIRTYSELIKLRSFKERFGYLVLRGDVGRSTFGHDRYLNQKFYTSREWKQLRPHIIARDLGNDLAADGYEIYNRLYIHHMNPLTIDDIANGDESLMNPDFLITTTHQTHNAIHYGDERLLPQPHVPRRPGDTVLWARKD